MFEIRFPLLKYLNFEMKSFVKKISLLIFYRIFIFQFFLEVHPWYELFSKQFLRLTHQDLIRSKKGAIAIVKCRPTCGCGCPFDWRSPTDAVVIRVGASV